MTVDKSIDVYVYVYGDTPAAAERGGYLYITLENVSWKSESTLESSGQTGAQDISPDTTIDVTPVP